MRRPTAQWLGCGMMALCLLGGDAFSQEAEPASEPTSAPAEWGQAKAGLQICLEAIGEPSVRGKLLFRLRLRNVGAEASPLPAAKELVGWLVLAQERNVWHGLRVFPAAEMKDWPAELAGGRTIEFPPIDLSQQPAYADAAREELLKAYLAQKDDAELPKPAGKLADLLKLGKAKARWVLLLPQKGQRPASLSSNTLDLLVGPPDFASLSAEARNAFVSDLLVQFRRDEWSAMQAHHTAVKAGKQFVPELISLAADRKAPYFARMWSATALADIRDDRSAQALTALVDDPSASVRAVVAYHGPKQKDAKLDETILARALAGADPTMTAWAVRGFWEFRRSVPEKLLQAGLASAEPKARAAAADALARQGAKAVPPLLALLKDKDEQVRAAAAKALASSPPSARRAVLAALVAALDLGGQAAMQAICQTLGKLAGRSMPYDTKADEAARQRTVQAWKDWWAQQKAG